HRPPVPPRGTSRRGVRALTACRWTPSKKRWETDTMSEQDTVQRVVLPIPAKPRTGLITYDAKDPDTHFPPIKELRPPTGAPNVLVILIDDAGFGSSSAFGGPCQTPNA